MRALFLNCTLKPRPEQSQTDHLLDKIEKLFAVENVEVERVRVNDFSMKLGVSLDEGAGDEFPKLYEKIKAADILIFGSPIWMGVRSSVLQHLIERLDGAYGDQNSLGQFGLYGKVAGVVVTGNEDGAHEVCATTLYNLTHLGCTIPPNVDCYYVGKAGPGPSYREDGGDRHLYTDRTARMLVKNTVFMAKILRENPISTNLQEIDAAAERAVEAGK